MRKQKIRQHNKHAAKYTVQEKRTEANRLARAERREKRIARAKASGVQPVARVVEPRNESPTQRTIRHGLHQALMEWQKLFKQIRRDRHHDKWHQHSITPLQLT